jgi:hypothetical protein
MLSSPGPQHYIVRIIGLVLLCNFVTYVATGQVFSPNVQVDDGEPYIQYCPSIAIGPNSELYVLFNDMREGGDIYFTKSLDKGKTWSHPNIRASDDCIWQWMISSCLEVDGEGILYACWGGDNRRDGDENDWDIYFTVSTNEGETWAPNVRVNDDSEDDKYGPSLVLAPDHSLCVAWTDDRPYNDTDIYFARSTDRGQTWTDPNIRVDDGAYGEQGEPCICADGEGTLYVGYSHRIYHNDVFHLYLVRSTDYGETWSKPAIRIDDGGYADHSEISLKVGPNGDLYATWWLFGGGKDNIVFTKSTDRGETWSEPIQVDHLPKGVWREDPDLVIGEDGTLYVAWTCWSVHGDGLPDVFFGMSTDDGLTWTDPSIQINDIWWDSQLIPKIALGKDQVIYSTWYDARNRTQDDATDIYFARTVPVLAYGESVLDTVIQGGHLEVTLTLINTTGYEHTSDVWTGMALLKGGMYYGVDPAFGPHTFFLAPYDTLFEYVNHGITEDFPLGEYEYWIKVDDEYPDYSHRTREVPRTHLFKDSFTFTVVESLPSDHWIPRRNRSRNP